MIKKLFFLFLYLSSSLCALTDLNLLCQDFILETKRISIPQYPWTFNPAIIRWDGKLLVFFRIRDPLTFATSQIGVTWLDEEFNPIGDPQILKVNYLRPPVLATDDNAQLPTVQDPRFIVFGDDLYMVYSNLVTTKNRNVTRMFISQIHYDGEKFYGDPPDILLNYEGIIDEKKEKNWAPFIYEDKLFLAYSLVPHKIFFPVPGTSSCNTVANSKSSMSKWYWGDIRGGTPALCIDGEYLAFFHCSKGMATVQSQGECITHYYMGAYTFSASYPFHITKISAKPLMHKTFYEGPAYPTWKPLLVVFPCGYIYDEDYIWISYGRQDFEMWVAKIDRKKLNKSLIPVQRIE